MAVVKPFCCIRPRSDLADRIAALPYDVYNREEALEEVKREPMSFLKIDRAETQFGPEVDTYDPKVYQKARATLQKMIEDGYFLRDCDECYFIYELTMDGRSQTGIAACSSIDDYVNGVIKKHENTRADKEEDRIRHVDACSAQTGPIFLAYRSDERINQIVKWKKREEPIYDFVSPDGVGHRVWRICERRLVEGLREAFADLDRIYIADGHHRAASAVKVGLMRRETHPDFNGTEEFNYFLSVLFPDDQLMILDYNRVVKDLNGLSTPEFLLKVKEKFELEEVGATPCRPSCKGEIGMYLDKSWYKLTVKRELRSEHPVDGLDVSILQRELLQPVLGIQDPKTDKRIDFVGGIRGLKELEKRVAADCQVAFAMYPTSIGELFAVADAGLLMPPKSTWFEPKLRSGLFIHQI
ncbi:DUF1015 domain-containing protein [Diplocloster agilis]|uniref:DUF1015 domain-containing protein n=1 Tax=Diplocloster agilis TaxID=2850323 RepID=UPI000821A321|nr:DUF1015 family protein [Suonthocola fibrivorans]MCU6736676.1 DUF1015 family protein [Suonthocola fibrivorans]SCJ92759.1 Uncharacterized conserved protein [uncultured Clostridium sp.]